MGARVPGDGGREMVRGREQRGSAHGPARTPLGQSGEAEHSSPSNGVRHTNYCTPGDLAVTLLGASPHRSTFRETRVHRFRIPAIIAALITALSACAALGGPEKPAAGTGLLESGSLTVSALSVADIAPLFYAVDQHLFGALDVRITTAKSGPDSVANLVSGSADVAFSSYSVFFVAGAKNAADIRIVSDGSAAPPGRQQLVSHPNSPVRNIKDLAGKRVGIAGKNSMSQLLTMSALKVNGID